MKTLITLALVLLTLGPCAQAQDQGQQVSLSQGPPNTPYHIVYGYSGSNVIYACYTPSTATTGVRYLTTLNISAATNASPVVFTTTASFDTATRPIVVIQGGTGNWTAVNGTFTATIVDSTHFSIPVNSTAFGAVTGTLTFQSYSTPLNQPFWAVQLYAYNGSNQVISTFWLGSTSATNQKCSDATSTTLNVQ